MTFADVIILVVVVAVIFAVVYFSLRDKKKNPCSGCPFQKSCEGKCNINENLEDGKDEEIK